MKDTHPRRIIGKRIRDSLPGLVETLQSAHPECLVSATHITATAITTLDVSSSVVRKYLTEAVHEGHIVEILVHRTWRVALERSRLLPTLYAVPHEGVPGVYRMVTERPESRGSDGISFLTTPEGYEEFLRRQRAAEYQRIPAPRSE